ncbi:hypothetical protein ACHAXR_005536 [Thalassiosira sp. AJA248-18]
MIHHAIIQTAVIQWIIATFATTACSFSMPPPTLSVDAKMHHYSSTKPMLGMFGDGASQDEVDFDMNTLDEVDDRGRRSILATTLLSSASLFNTVNPASAAGGDEFDTPMNGLTRQIRTSVVRGAQLIDKADGRWERFSDDLGLGSERNQPKRNVIDAGGNERSKKVVRSDVVVDERDLVLDEMFAFGLLQECDEAFLSCLNSQQSQTSVSKGGLNTQIEQTKQLVRKSFFSSSTPTSAEEFNFECYTHFKVFNEVLINKKVLFPPFQREFESLIGNRILQLALQQQPELLSSVVPSPTNLTERLQNALGSTDAIAALLQQKGLVTSWERSIPPDDDIEDFTSPTTSSDNFSVSLDLAYSLALNGDITLNSQLLLQELGYRMYPSFGRWLVHVGVPRCFSSKDSTGGEIAVQIDDYYMDTSYNSNPDLFEVKQVLLNIVIQRD